MSKKKRVDPYVIGIERRVQQLGYRFDARKRLRELYDQMLPLCETWTENPEDEKKLDAFEHEAKAVGVVLRSGGMVMDRKMVSRLLDDMTDVLDWISTELAAA